MAHEIDLVELQPLDHGAQIGCEPAHAVAARRRGRIAVAAHVEGHHAQSPRQLLKLVPVGRAGERPRGDDDERPALTRLHVVELDAVSDAHHPVDELRGHLNPP